MFIGTGHFEGSLPSAIRSLSSQPSQAQSTLTGYRITVRHLTRLIGKTKLVELKVRDVGLALGTLAERFSTRSVRLARMMSSENTGD